MSSNNPGRTPVNHASRKRFVLPAVVIFSALGSTGSDIYAADYSWNCLSDSNWEDINCWSVFASAPGALDDVSIARPYQVTINNVTGNAAASTLDINSYGTLRQTAGSTFTVSDEYVGTYTTGTYSQEGGTHGVDADYIGYNSGAVGIYYMQEGVHNANRLALGYAGGTGYYSMTGGTTNTDQTWIGSNGSVGTAAVRGANFSAATGIYVGGDNTASGGTGTFNVLSGGMVTAGELTVWNDSSRIDSGSTATDGVINVNGELLLTGGGAANSYRGIVDRSYSNTATSQILADDATITGIGSEWTTSGNFYVGATGFGELIVENGGQLSSGNDLFVSQGGASTANLKVRSGGQVATDRHLVLGWSDGAKGAVDVSGVESKLDVLGNTYLGGNFTGNANGEGYLELANGAEMKTGNLTVWNGDGLTNNIWLDGTFTVLDIDGALALQGALLRALERSSIS